MYSQFKKKGRSEIAFLKVIYKGFFFNLLLFCMLTECVQSIILLKTA